MTPMQWHRHWHAVTPPMNTLQPTKASQWIAHTTIRLARNNLQESPARSNSAPLISIQVLGTDMKTCSGLCNTLMWMLAYSWKSISLATSTCPGNVATTFWYLKLQGSTYQGGVALFWWYSQIPTSWQLKDPNMASGSWHLAIQDGWLLVPTYPPAFDYQPFIDLINMGTGWPPSFEPPGGLFNWLGLIYRAWVIFVSSMLKLALDRDVPVMAEAWSKVVPWVTGMLSSLLANLTPDLGVAMVLKVELISLTSQCLPTILPELGWGWLSPHPQEMWGLHPDSLNHQVQHQPW